MYLNDFVQEIDVIIIDLVNIDINVAPPTPPTIIELSIANSLFIFVT